MAQLLGYDVPAEAKITGLDHWPGFADWAERQGYDLSNPMASEIVSLYEAFVEGGFQEFQRQRERQSAA